MMMMMMMMMMMNDDCDSNVVVGEFSIHSEKHVQDFHNCFQVVSILIGHEADVNCVRVITATLQLSVIPSPYLWCLLNCLVCTGTDIYACVKLC